MTRAPRRDFRGCWLHITNRGIAKRTIFLDRADVRFFLARIAREVRAGKIEIHAYSLLGTHFHLLVRSLTGEISGVMQRVQDKYARWFNRRRKRDGHLFRSRFWSREVHSAAYWECLVHYIDRNAVEAGMVQSPEDYPYASAWHGSGRRAPVWLRQELVQAVHSAGPSRADGAAIVAELVSHPAAPGPEEIPLDDLLDSPPERVRDWMRRKARLADGPSANLLLATAGTVMQTLREHSRLCPDWSPAGSSRVRPGWAILLAGLLRTSCRLSLSEVSARVGSSRNAVARRTREHLEFLSDDGEYALLAASILQEALVRDYGRPNAPPELLDALQNVEQSGSGTVCVKSRA